MRLLRFFLVLVYASYLAYAGLIFMLLPWSTLWALALEKLPVALAVPLGRPALRGMLSAFGFLHFIVALSEIHISPAIQKNSTRAGGPSAR